MDERLRFVQDVHRPGWSIAALCRRYGVSRKTGYKWLAIYERCGAAGLADTSRRPHSCPHATPPAVVELILQLQRRYTWGRGKSAGCYEPGSRRSRSPPRPRFIGFSSGTAG